ncbi:hypothetical protein RMSM_00373, partial [Rhodopirellula maiorica SM1]
MAPLVLRILIEERTSFVSASDLSPHRPHPARFRYLCQLIENVGNAISMASVTDPDPLHHPDPLVSNAMIEDDVYEEPNPRRRFLIFSAMPAWAVSTFVHVIILLVLGLVSIGDPVRVVNVLSASATAEDGPEMEEFAIEQLDPGEVAEMEE